ncbi:hypothetical protein Ctob_011699 [Chrysochromulina tobinii]|uniref:Uncharacterized protein n=1 Tax=Chrysochromulina tobinii TaxID=1460289 RepID=A0A0M0JXP9_9EUKA|nr:hypothetical protein Ctob_011699 [Chrysochromulina tobinii]|eukprot:KOO30913.1 hypothetical protein Ctob_011699 [Chrysochromulina sp. CCMP291]
MTVRKRQRAAKNHATKNRRIRGASRSAHALAHYQNGVVDKAPLKKKKGKVEPGKRVIAEWLPIKGAPLCVTRNAAGKPRYYIDEKAIKQFRLAQSYTPRSKNGAPKEGAIKLKEMLGAEGKLICCKTGRALGYVSRSGVPYGVSSFQLDHIDPKRPTMSQGRKYKDYLHAYEQGHIEIKCYEYIGLQYNLQGLQHGGNSRNYAAP